MHGYYYVPFTFCKASECVYTMAKIVLPIKIIRFFDEDQEARVCSITKPAIESL